MPWNGWWHMGWMWLFWIVVIVAVVFLARSLGTGSRGARSANETAEDILKQRYAKGEIDREEYERKLSDLRR